MCWPSHCFNEIIKFQPDKWIMEFEVQFIASDANRNIWRHPIRLWNFDTWKKCPIHRYENVENHLFESYTRKLVLKWLNSEISINLRIEYRTCINIKRTRRLMCSNAMCLCILYLYKGYSIRDDGADGIIHVVWRYKMGHHAIHSSRSSIQATYMLWTGDFSMEKTTTTYNLANAKWCNTKNHSSKRVFCMRMKYFIVELKWRGGVSGCCLVQFLFVVDFVFFLYCFWTSLLHFDRTVVVAIYLLVIRLPSISYEWRWCKVDVFTCRLDAYVIALIFHQLMILWFKRQNNKKWKCLKLLPLKLELSFLLHHPPHSIPSYCFL